LVKMTEFAAAPRCSRFVRGVNGTEAMLFIFSSCPTLASYTGVTLHCGTTSSLDIGKQRLGSHRPI
jgi:hypothetical protein